MEKASPFTESELNSLRNMQLELRESSIKKFELYTNLSVEERIMNEKFMIEVGKYIRSMDEEKLAEAVFT